MHGKEKARFLSMISERLVNILTKFLQQDNDSALCCKCTNLHHKMRRVCQIQDEYTIEKTNTERKRQIFRKPVQCAENVRMNQKIVDCAENRPEERKQRTDNPLNISPSFRVVPEFDFHATNKNQTGNVFHQRNGKRHQHKQQQLSPPCILHRNQRFQHRQEIKDAQARAVQRQVWPYQKTGVHPVMGGKKSAKQHF